MHRTEAHIAKRARELNLHMQISFSEDEEEDELVIAPPVAATSTAPASNFRGIIFSDDDAESDGGMDLDGANPFSPIAPSRRAQTQQSQSQTQQQLGALAETQVDTQYDAQLTAHSPSSPTTRTRTQPQISSGGQVNDDFAGIFSPSDTSLHDDIDQEAEPQQQTTQSVRKATMPSVTGSSAKKPRMRTAPAVVESSKPAAWDLDDDGPDLLEQRSLALLKATGGEISDDDSISAEKKKRAAVSTGRRGLAKRAKSAAVRKGVDSDEDDDDLFGKNDSDAGDMVVSEGAAVASAPVALTEQERRDQNILRMKKRSMRIESDDDE